MKKKIRSLNMYSAISTLIKKYHLDGMYKWYGLANDISYGIKLGRGDKGELIVFAFKSVFYLPGMGGGGGVV